MIMDLLLVLTGVLIGLLSGLIGVGGGIFLVPLLVIGFGFSQHVAQGTSLAALIPGSAVGALTHHLQGNVVVKAATWSAIAGVGGVGVGSVVALHTPREVLGRIFGALLIFSAYRLWPRRHNGEAHADTG